MTPTDRAAISKGRLWTAPHPERIAALFLLMDGAMNSSTRVVVEATRACAIPNPRLSSLGVVDWPALCFTEPRRQFWIVPV